MCFNYKIKLHEINGFKCYFIQKNCLLFMVIINSETVKRIKLF